MFARTFVSALAALAIASPVWAADLPANAPPGGDFKKVSTLVKLPNFIPGLGTLYVDPKTLPVGPFVAYDKNGKKTSTIYMVPLSDLQAHKKIEDLTTAGGDVKRVDFHFNAGHPGVPNPHYHIILWHVAPSDAAL